MAGKSKSQKHPLQRFVACPRCAKARLDAVKGGFRCRRCETAFPELDGIPWLFANPAVAWSEWRDRFDFAMKTLDRDAAGCERAAEGAERPATALRLEAMARARREQAQALASLMAPLDLGNLEANYATYLALRTRLPADQGLHTYYANVHRDWVWGEEENRISAALVSEALGSDAVDTLLVLGSGASRLAYDLHQTRENALSIALDFNPMLLLIAKKMFAGEPLDFYEFPIAPRTGADNAVLQTLAAPAAARPGLHLVAGDALRPPFAAGSADALVTPWLIDVIPEDFATLCRRINPLLRAGGRWVIYGSLAFSNQDPALNYGPEEVEGLLGEAGFGAIERREETIPYLCSPHSRHGRRERVVALRAEKLEDTDAPPRYVALPDFLVVEDEPVPLLEAFQLQAMTTRIHAFMMTLIDGNRSIADMAQLMEDHKLMPRDQALPTVRNFLIKMFDESRRQTGI